MSPKHRRYEASGINIGVGEAPWSDLPVQVAEAEPFLQEHRDEILKLRAFPGVEGLTPRLSDRAAHDEKVWAQSDRFPASLVRIALGFAVNVTPRRHRRWASTLTLGMNAMSSTIRFYFDYESPNAYLAWTQLPKLAHRYGCTVDPVPVLYAALLDAHGQLGPGEVPAKGLWMSKNMARKAVLLGVPLNPPAFLPFNPLLALRVTLLASQTAERDALIGALFRAVWVDGLHVSDAAVVERVADEVGLSGAVLVAQTQRPEIKEQLRSQTAEAISRGVFGVPSMEVADELFWGYDDFPFLELFLAGKDPLDAAEWRKQSRPVRASSVRRQFRSTKDGA